MDDAYLVFKEHIGEKWLDNKIAAIPDMTFLEKLCGREKVLEHIIHIDGVTGSSPVAATTIPLPKG